MSQSLRRPRTPAVPSWTPENDPAIRTAGRRQNGNGDLVVSAAIGEVVLLPRLWDFVIEEDAGDRIVLHSASGIVATLDCGADGAVDVQRIAATAESARLTERTAS